MSHGDQMNHDKYYNSALDYPFYEFNHHSSPDNMAIKFGKFAQ